MKRNFFVENDYLCKKINNKILHIFSTKGINNIDYILKILNDSKI